MPSLKRLRKSSSTACAWPPIVSRLPKVFIVILLIDAPSVLYLGMLIVTAPLYLSLEKTSTFSGLLSEIRKGV